MSADTPLVCPVEPHEMNKTLRFGLNDIVRRVVCVATMQGVGRDLMLRVYLAGLFHGVELSKRRTALGVDANQSHSATNNSVGEHDHA